MNSQAQAPSTSASARSRTNPKVPKILISKRQQKDDDNDGPKTPAKRDRLEVPSDSQEAPAPSRPKSNLSNLTTTSSSSNSSSTMLNASTTNNGESLGAGTGNVSVSPRNKPRLSFDEMSIQRQEDWRRQSEDVRNNQQSDGGGGGIATISDKIPQSQQGSISVNELTRKGTQVSRRGSNMSAPANANHLSYEPSLKSAPSHPSLQDDNCSEIVRVENGSDHRNDSNSFMDKVNGQKLRRFVNVFRVC